MKRAATDKHVKEIIKRHLENAEIEVTDEQLEKIQDSLSFSFYMLMLETLNETNSMSYTSFILAYGREKNGGPTESTEPKSE
jgi:beta-glucosidase/6-phospho-beta-glucosidase/beta-galactosidase